MVDYSRNVPINLPLPERPPTPTPIAIIAIAMMRFPVSHFESSHEQIFLETNETFFLHHFDEVALLLLG